MVHPLNGEDKHLQFQLIYQTSAASTTGTCILETTAPMQLMGSVTQI